MVLSIRYSNHSPHNDSERLPPATKALDTVSGKCRLFSKRMKGAIRHWSTGLKKMSGFIANERGMFSFGEVDALVGEIERLRANVSQLESRIDQLNQLAYRDGLVDVLNRRGFIANLEKVIARVTRYGDQAAMLFIDLDGLKQINDRFGHAAGDAALVQVAKIIVASVRDSDCVGRLGGDEFAVILERADELSAWQMGLRIVETVVGSQYCVDGICLPLSVAVGVGAIERGDTAQAVIERADKAMYQVKAA